ncbi:hypothetical protein [Streptomyces sp. S.PB5]|uniref:phage tail assembly protein T n=1 Tax=Streptomyces sp. S.PB5 TaxID=3020844 RepID=UPI0025AF1DF1|nr:hypothetical protein [Streptomyces sp. S.PB5]MDN3021534.1 hypothetical protein [Streptomyces sp. S.PB5]
MAFKAPPGEVMQRFTDEEIVHLVAYQNLYGPITPKRLDVLLARLAMDLMSPHLKRGRRTVLRDHLMVWSRADRPRQSGREMLAIVKNLQAQYDRDDEQRAQRIRRTRRKAVAHGGSG